MTLDLVLLIVAAVCFGIAAFNLSSKLNFVALVLLAWVLTAIV